MTSTASTTEIKETINKLIEICRDGQYGFEIAAKGVTDPVLKAELLQYSGQRMEFAAELNDALRHLHEEPEDHGTVAGALHRGWINLKQAIASNDRLAVLGECERGEDVAVDAYRKAVVAGLPPMISGIVNTQWQAITRVHDRIVSLREAAKRDAAAAGTESLQPRPNA